MSLDFYPPMIHEGDLTPDAFGSEVDKLCEEIHAACKGFGTNEKRLLTAMGSMTPEMRCKVPVRYKELYDKQLKDVMKSECGNRDFGTALQLLSSPPDQAECGMIHRACKGLGTNETLLFTIICGRSNKEMEILKKQYFKLFDKDLGSLLNSELGGHFETLIFTCLQASEEGYDEGYHDDAKMQEDVEKLYKMGQGKFGTDEKGLFKILSASPPDYIKKLNLLYADKYGFTLVKVLETELRGDLKTAAMFMINMKTKPYVAVCRLIKEACKGFGTNELLLTCTIIRYQGIMKEIMIAFVEEFGETIQDVVKGEVRGDYQKLLLAVLDSAP